MAAGAGNQLRGHRILVVDDAQHVRETFQRLLESAGAHVVATSSGRNALELAAGGGFDAVLIDVKLPDMAGDQVVRQLHGSKPRPRIVAITGMGQEALDRAKAAGADVVLAKPFGGERLIACLSSGGSGHRETTEPAAGDRSRSQIWCPNCRGYTDHQVCSDRLDAPAAEGGHPASCWVCAACLRHTMSGAGR